MKAGFNDLFLDRSAQTNVKLPKGFGSSDAIGSVVRLATNNQLGETSLYLELYDKKGSANVVTKATAENFLKYLKKGRYDQSILHRSVPGFVLQGGGYLAPLSPADEGGTVNPIPTFKTIKNQPGNPNLRGTIAMAKLAGDPDSATSQWFVNVGDNLELDTQNEGFTVFGEVLGRGMKVVDQLASAEIYNFGASFGELPLWDLERNDDNSVTVSPDDFLIIKSAKRLKSKNQPFFLSVESSDESIVTARITKNQRIKLKASDSASGSAEIYVEAISLVDGTADVDRFDVVIEGALRNERSMPRSARKRCKRIDVFVDGGSFEDPFYRFYDSEGSEFESLRLNVKKKYRFYRLGGVESKPFYVGDSGYKGISSGALRLKGNGSVVDGITGSEMLTVSVQKSHRKEFKKEGILSYFCTTHPEMIGSFAIKGRKDVAILASQQTATTDPMITDSTAHSSGSSYRVAIDAINQLPLI